MQMLELQSAAQLQTLLILSFFQYKERTSEQEVNDGLDLDPGAFLVIEGNQC